MTANQTRLLVLLTAILGAAALRLVPHPPNFTPIGAMALFGAAHLGRKPIALAAPLLALLLSDMVLGFYSGMWVQYVAVALIVALGWAALKRVSVLTVAGSAVASAILFFVVTNLGTWLLSGMYPLTGAGLAACFTAAIPFFQNTLAGDLFYCGLLFGGFALLEKLVPSLATETSARPA